MDMKRTQDYYEQLSYDVLIVRITLGRLNVNIRLSQNICRN